MLTEVQIGCLLIDTNTDQPVIMLQDVSGRRAIPIVIGLAEAGAIASELENIEFPRPMTHDLMRSLVESLDATVKHVVINDLRDNTFFARVVLIHGGKRLKVDARPSDAAAARRSSPPNTCSNRPRFRPKKKRRTSVCPRASPRPPSRCHERMTPMP